MGHGFWVFGYGSLLWNPGFDFDDRAVARLWGFQRSFCMWSIHHRGTPENPGLVLALDRTDGAFCDGLAFHVPAHTSEKTLDYLRDRELISSAYVEDHQEISLRDGRQVESLVYVVDPTHSQYCGGLSLERQAQVIAGAVGGRGPNPDYLWMTAQQLHDLGLGDDNLDWLATRV
ncbi:MAG: gamma-glutamylcyclotransferase, partial [Pseudomonadota bacterium]